MDAVDPINLMDAGAFDGNISTSRLLGDPVEPVIMASDTPVGVFDEGQLASQGFLSSLSPSMISQPEASLGHVTPVPNTFTDKVPRTQGSPRRYPAQGNGNGGGQQPTRRIPGANREVPGLDDDDCFETDVNDFLMRYPRKQLTVFDEMISVTCGRAAKPGRPAQHADQTIKFSVLRVQDSEDQLCASCKGPAATVSNLDAPIRVAWCAACKKIKRSRIPATPNISQAVDDSVWNDFSVHVGYDPTYVNPAAVGPNAPTLLSRAKSTNPLGSIHEITTSQGKKTLPDYLPRNWQRAADPDHHMPTSVAVSGDYRLIARIAQPPPTKREKNPWRVLRVSVLETESTLHEIPLNPTAKVQLVNFSYDGSLLLVCFHHGADEIDRPRMVLWSMVTGMKVFQSANNQRQNIVACSISRNMDKLFSVILSDSSEKPSVRLQIDNLLADENIQEIREDYGALVPNEHMSKVDYPKLLHPYTYKRLGAGYQAVILEEGWKASAELDAWLRQNNKRVPAICSMSEDGKVFAHVFDSDREKKGRPREVTLNEETLEAAVKDGDFMSLRPDAHTVLVWDIERDELVHSFVLEREVTTVHVSRNGTLLVVGMSGKVGAASEFDREQAILIVYSLITREELWRCETPHDVDSVALKKGRLEMTLRRGDGGPTSHRRYALTTSESIAFTLRALRGTIAVCEMQERLDNKRAARNPEQDDDPSSFKNLKDMAMANDSDGGDDDDDDDDEFPVDGDEGELKTSVALQNQELPRVPSMPRTVSADNAAPPPVLIQEHLEASGPVQSISTSDDQKWYVLRRRLADHKRASCITVGSIGQGGLRIQLHFALRLSKDEVKELGRRDRKKSSAADGPSDLHAEVSCLCISNDGALVACGIRNTTRVLVLSAVDLGTVWEFDAEAVPKALCITGEILTVMSDNVQSQSFAERQCSIETYSLITKFALHKTAQKCSLRTVGIADNGQRRIVEDEDGTIQIEHLKTGKVLYSIQDHTKELLGVSASGDLLIMRDKQPRADGYSETEEIKLSWQSLPNFIAFGPSDNTVWTWKCSQDIEGELLPLKDHLAHWILLDQQGQPEPERLSRAPSGEERRESASHVTSVNKRADKLALPSEGFGLSGLVAYLVQAKEFGALKVVMDACPVFWACYSYVDTDGAMGKSYFGHALDSNDRILSQMLLDAVTDVVSDQDGAHTPVMQMTQVTGFIQKALEEQRMVDKVEEFLRELPLIKIDESTSTPVFARFEDDVISTAWNSRDVVAGAYAWTFEQIEERVEEREGGAEGRERGYKYVSALPGLCDLDFIQPFVLANASPGLVDNESLRAAIAVLERDLEPHYFGVAVSKQFLIFMTGLTCYCGFIELCVVVDDTRIESLAQTHLGRFGLFLALVAWACDVYLIFVEVRQCRHHKTLHTYIKAWTIIPWLSHSTAIMSYIFVITRAGMTAIRGTTAMAAVMLFNTVFVYVRSYRPMSSLVGMLIEIGKDMILFCVVVLILICSFASGFYSLHGRVTELDVIDAGAYQNIFFGVGDSLVQTFMMSVLGDFSVSALESQLADVDREALSYLSFFLFFVLAMLVSVVAMNALIAIMGDTYARVADPALEQAVLDKEIGSVLVDRLRLLGPEANAVFQRRHRWIHVLSPSEKGSMPAGNAYGGGLITMKKEIKEMLDASVKLINGELRDIKEMKEAKPEAKDGNAEETERWMRQIEEIRQGFKDKQKILERKHKQREEDLKRMAEFAEAGSLSKIAATMDLLFQQVENIEYFIRTNGVPPPMREDTEFNMATAHQFRAPDDSTLRSRVLANRQEWPQPRGRG